MRGRSSIEVYVGRHGHVCIKQQNFYECERDWPVIALDPEQARRVAQWVLDALPEATAAFSNVEDDGPTSAESTADIGADKLSQN